jgi:hypothetical protein
VVCGQSGEAGAVDGSFVSATELLSKADQRLRGGAKPG